MSTIVGLRNLPNAIRSLGALASPDYVDLYTVTTSEATDKSPEEWARAVLEDTPLGRSAPALWRLLAFVLGRRIRGVRAGVEDRRSRRQLDQARGGLMVHDRPCRRPGRRGRHVSVALFLRYDRPMASLVWPPVSIMHRRAVPAMLRQALRGQ